MLLNLMKISRKLGKKCFKKVKKNAIKSLIQKLNTETAAEAHSVSPMPVKLVDKSLFQTFTEIINIYMKQNNFPNNSKVAPLVSLEKDKQNKYNVSNFRPFSVLRTYSKIYQQVVNKQRNNFHLKY